MSTSLLICDDSSFARKQMVRALPENWDVEITFAANGKECIDAIRAGKGDFLLLDLNMPVMNGYEVLETIKQEDLPSIVIVVSGDIQPEAKAKVMRLGALDFVEKPIDKDRLYKVLNEYGFISEKDTAKNKSFEASENINVEYYDCYQELANVAMGQAADLLAKLLNVFVSIPIPTVNLIEVSDLHMTLQSANNSDDITAVCQGFMGAGITGEALLVFNDSSFTDISKLMRYEGRIDDAVEIELLMDISGLLIGAYLKGIANQLDITFGQGHPVVLGQHCKIADLIGNSPSWRKTLAIDVNYKIKDHDINCDLLLLFTEDSIQKLNERVACLI